MTPRKRSAIVLSGLLLCPLISRAQHEMLNHVFGNGVTTTGSSTNRIRGTLGPLPLGSANSENFSLAGGFWIQSSELVTDVEKPGAGDVPTRFLLHQNYPNPFNPATTLRFEIPRQSQVSLELYDILGRRIAVLLDAELAPGVHDFSFEASDLESGVYLYRLKSDGFSQTRKLLRLK